MADWSVGVNDAVAVKQFSSRLFKQSITKTIAYRLAQISSSISSEENIVQILDDTQKKQGDQITYDLIGKLSGAGVEGDNELAGSEESLTPYTASILINQLRHAVKIRGAMSQQRIPFSMRDTARVRLADWWQERMNLATINQACGNTNQADTRYTGENATTAPTTGSLVWTSADHTTEGTLDSDDVMAPSYLLDVVMKAHTRTFPIKAIMLKGMQVNGVALLHPGQVKSLKAGYSAGNWGDIQKAAMTGGQITGNPIFTGSIGMLEGVVLHEDAQIPYGSGAGTGNDAAAGPNPLGTANVARGVFMGAQALCMAFGRAYDTMTKVKWFEELLDGGNQLRVAAGKIYGVKKNVFNLQDFATITISSWVA